MKVDPEYLVQAVREFQEKWGAPPGEPYSWGIAREIATDLAIAHLPPEAQEEFIANREAFMSFLKMHAEYPHERQQNERQVRLDRQPRRSRKKVGS